MLENNYFIINHEERVTLSDVLNCFTKDSKLYLSEKTGEWVDGNRSIILESIRKGKVI